MSTENIKAKDMTSFEGPVDTGNPHGKRPADKSVGDSQPDESVAKKGKKGTELPGTTTVGEEVSALFSGVEGLSEDFVSKASTIFEGAVSEKIAIIREEIEADYAAKLEESYSQLAEDLETKLDEYLNLFIENYLEENKVAIEGGFRKEIAEQVIANIVSIVESAGVDLPEDKVDIAEALVSENEELESKLNESLNDNIALKKQLREFEVKEVFVKQTEGLSEGAKDKLRKLMENVDYADTEQYATKLEVLKESVSERAPTADKTNLTEEAPVKEQAQSTLDPRMQAYINAARGSGIL